jgi:hypothetical protein
VKHAWIRKADDSVGWEKIGINIYGTLSTKFFEVAKRLYGFIKKSNSCLTQVAT